MRSHLEVDATCHRFKGHGTRHWLGCRYCYCIKLDCRLCTRGEGAACTPLSSSMRCDSSWLSRDSRVARDEQTKRFLFSETHSRHMNTFVYCIYILYLFLLLQSFFPRFPSLSLLLVPSILLPPSFFFAFFSFGCFYAYIPTCIYKNIYIYIYDLYVIYNI